MEDLAKRLPLINHYILKNLDGKTMMNFKQSSKGIYQTLDREKYCWIKLINKYYERFEKFQDPWKKVTSKTPVRIVKKLAVAVHKFFKNKPSRRMKQWHPLFIAADQGLLELYKFIVRKTGEENPSRVSGLTPFHFSAKKVI